MVALHSTYALFNSHETIGDIGYGELNDHSWGKAVVASRRARVGLI
jgi:hypothetical protein